MKMLTVASTLIVALGLGAGAAFAQVAAPGDVPAPAEVTSAEVAAPAEGAASAEAPAPAAALGDLSADELGALTTDETAAAGNTSQPLDIYGFMDFTYGHAFLSKGRKFTFDGYPRDNFAVGNINVYLAKKVTERCRTLIEVRFLYLPNGSSESGSKAYVDSSVPDPADFSRPLRWGGIEIERAHGECDLTQNLTLRMGQWLTPYGIWNIDHGTPTLIALRRPFVIGNELFPERQTGFQLHGAHVKGPLRIGYAATLSNGRGPIDAYHDLDQNKAIGGRLELGYTGAAEVTLGTSLYRGRYTQAEAVSFGTTLQPILLQYDEQSIGFDLQVNWKGLALRGEHITNERAYTDKGRPMTSGGYLADGTQSGYYGLAGYRLPWWGVMPYALYMQIHPVPDPNATFTAKLWGVHAGLNIVVSPFVVVKLEYMTSGVIDPPAGVPALKEKLKNFEAQIAWAF